jgi:hypothetical protein
MISKWPSMRPCDSALIDALAASRKMAKVEARYLKNIDMSIKK